MSSRSVGRGSAAARSIRLALRASSIVATSRPSLARWVFRCRGSLAAKSALIPSLTCSIPPIRHPTQPGAASAAWPLPSLKAKLMDGKGQDPARLALDVRAQVPGAGPGDQGRVGELVVVRDPAVLRLLGGLDHRPARVPHVADAV